MQAKRVEIDSKGRLKYIPSRLVAYILTDTYHDPNLLVVLASRGMLVFERLYIYST